MFETTNWLMSINVWTYRILQGKMVRNHIPILDGHWMAILLGQTLGSPLWLGDSIDSHAPVPSKVSSKSRMFVMSAPGKIEWYRAWSWRNTNDCSWRLKWCLLCTKNVSYPHIYIYIYIQIYTEHIQSIYWYITITATGKTQWYTWSLSDTIMYIILCICVYTILYIYMCLYMYMQYMQYIYIYICLIMFADMKATRSLSGARVLQFSWLSSVQTTRTCDIPPFRWSIPFPGRWTLSVGVTTFPILMESLR